MTSFWSCHLNNTVTRVSECKLKFLLFVIMILNNFQCFVWKVFFYIDHDTSFLEKRKTHFWFYFLQRKIWIIIFSLKRFYKACTKLTPLILGLFSTIFQICMKNIKISTHVSRCNRIIYQMSAYLFLFSLACFYDRIIRLSLCHGFAWQMIILIGHWILSIQKLPLPEKLL